MTGMERVLCALRGEPADRRAFTLALSLYGSRLSGCPTREYYSEPVRYLEGQREVVRLMDPDIVFAPFALPFEALAYGGEGIWLDRFPPNVRKPPFREHGQVRPLGDDLLRSPGVAYLIESTRLLAEEFGPDKAVCAVVTAPVDLPAMLLGIETWLETLLFDHERAAHLMDLATEHFLRLTGACFAAGASFVAVPVMFANLRLVTPALLEKNILPELARAFGQAKGPLVYHHGGNRILDHLGLYSNLPGVAGFLFDPRDDLAHARETLGLGRLMLGNVNGPGLARMQPGDAYASVSAILANRAGDRNFVLASAHADIPFDTNPDTLLAVRRAVVDAGAVA
ncbi:MAG: uroporphyrinogen decarboxylase family protein [Desulfomicrobium sp.]|nr:uroporphyrinogen decarboxylase family protein [Pseudomonadota bacterium]MBV1710797.1 uroporphyrinogen decarboxylase family protein [Desulfomicrobium sp.]MBU4571424.1 uroporphyrinogen decarboxylase family protein [Pseudomonadota bacterium]MBU4594412.1 uroporphyrinogen decarboxylase family protein [Pseudomonadota bacterium]MBV1720267.1 uroporphyrinogen decarboxylase family protein [Desulfomicrobium sp.]